MPIGPLVGSSGKALDRGEGSKAAPPCVKEILPFADLRMHNFRPFFQSKLNFGELEMLYFRPVLSLNF